MARPSRPAPGPSGNPPPGPDRRGDAPGPPGKASPGAGRRSDASDPSGNTSPGPGRRGGAFRSAPAASPPADRPRRRSADPRSADPRPAAPRDAGPPASGRRPSSRPRPSASPAPAAAAADSGPPDRGLARLNPITWLGFGAARSAPPGGQTAAGDPAGGATATAVLDPGAAPDGAAAQPRGASRWRIAFFLLAGFGLIVAVAWALLDSRFLVVRSVEVTGTHLVPKSEVIAAANVQKGLPLIRVNTSSVARRVEHITQIQSVHVTRDWPDTLVIAVQERHAALAIPDAGRFYLVDPSGVVVQQVSKRAAGLPLFTPVGPAPGNPGIRVAADVIRSLPASLAREVKSITVPDPYAVTLHLSSGVTVNWGSVGSTAQKMRELAILMGTHARYYDVSAPGSVATSG